MGGRALHLGLDVGTQGTKALLVDGEDGRVVARAARSYGLIAGLPEGAAEQHPGTWTAAVEECAREVLASARCGARELRGVGVSGQQHGLVLVDARGEVLRPAKLWCDTSTADEARELSGLLGRRIPAGFTAPKVLWTARREPQVWRRARWVLLPHDFVNLALTGRSSAEAGDASGTGWLDVARRQWDLDSARAIDPALPERLPALTPPGEPAGALSAEGARLLGLPGAEGAPVAAGGGDNMCAAIGAGATRPGVAVLSLGTSATLFGFAAGPVLDPEGLVAGFCDSTGGWLPLLCVMNATGVLEEVCAAFGTDHEALARDAAQVEPGCGGLLFVPYLQGERVPDLPRARGVLHGLRPGHLRPGVLYRAALEGVALNLAWGAERLRALGLDLRTLRAVGGGARNELWLAILADALGATVERCAERESAAFGAALQSLWTVRRTQGQGAGADAVAAAFARVRGAPIEPDPRRASLYAGRGEALRELTGRLFRAGDA